MMQKLFPLHRYLTQSSQLRALFVYVLSLLTLTAAVIVVYMLPVGNTIRLIDAIQRGEFMQIWWGHAIVVTTLITYVLVRLGRLNLASWVLLLGVAIAVIVSNLRTNLDQPLDFLMLPTLILVAGLLLSWKSFLMMTAAIIASYAGFALLGVPRQMAPNTLANDVMMTVGLITFALIVFFFQRIVNASRAEGELVAGKERFKLAEINTAIARQASERVSLQQTLDTTLKILTENYPQIYHAQVFLIDEDGVQARLVASTGEAGKKLLERNHTLAVGSVSVIGQATFKGEPVIAYAGEDSGIHRRNELLPDTRLEAAFPLRIGTAVIGALDLQSRQLLSLSEYDRYTFQSMADSLSLAVDSIRQFEAARARVEENQRLAEQARSALREVERLNQRLIGRAWSEYLQNHGSGMGLNVDFEQDQIVADASWTEALLDAAQSNHMVQNDQVIAVPLRVRGQVIGALEVELSEDYEFTGEDLELLQDISERFGLAAENTRLIEESQRTAQRETLINEISSRLITATNVEATLAEAARSMTETLQANRVMIRLGVPAEDRRAAAAANGGKE